MTTIRNYAPQKFEKEPAVSGIIYGRGTFESEFPAQERAELLNGALRSLDGSTLASGTQIRAATMLVRHLTSYRLR